jgi:hypothetical protein
MMDELADRLIYQSKGKISCQHVLDIRPKIKIEASFSANGVLFPNTRPHQEVTETGTYLFILSSHTAIQYRARGLLVKKAWVWEPPHQATLRPEILTWTASGPGSLTQGKGGQSVKMHSYGSVSFSPAFKRVTPSNRESIYDGYLNEGNFETEIDEQGNINAKVWRVKGGTIESVKKSKNIDK